MIAIRGYTNKFFQIVAAVASVFIFTGCAGVAISKNDVATMDPIVFVVTETPPLIWNTWSLAFKEAYPLSPLATEIYKSTSQPPGLLPPEIPDIGNLIKTRAHRAFGEKLSWWPKMIISTEATATSLIDSNIMRASVERYRIAGGGNLVVLVRFTLHDKTGREVWWRVSQYHGIFDGVGDTVEERLLKGVGVDEEFERAADVVVEDVLAKLSAAN